MPKAEVDPELVRCRFCGSRDWTKHGVRKNKGIARQRYKCRDCERTFTFDDGFLKSKFDPRVVVVAVDLHYRGFSLGEIKKYLKMRHDLSVSRPTVLQWLNKHKKGLKKYLEDFRRREGDHLSALWEMGDKSE